MDNNLPTDYGNGRLSDFNVKAFIDAANEYVRADEVLEALKLLNNLPAFYRDNPPLEVLRLKDDIIRRIMTIHDYASYKDEQVADSEHIETYSQTMRYQMIKYDVGYFNKKGIEPHIVDYGPGGYYVPLALKKDGLKFTYNDLCINSDLRNAGREAIGDVHLITKSTERPVIFVACEIIEHLYNDVEIRAEQLKWAEDCDVIHISTPKYSFDSMASVKQVWDTRMQFGHLKTFSVNTLNKSICSLFWDYEWQLFDSQILHMRGMNRKSKFKHYLEIKG